MEVGQTVYLKPIENMARGIKDDIINHVIESKIFKIGRKYFYVDQWKDIKFNISNLMEVSDGCSDWKVYFSKQDIIDEQEHKVLIHKLRMVFDWGNIAMKNKLTLDQLRRIDKIISE